MHTGARSTEGKTSTTRVVLVCGGKDGVYAETPRSCCFVRQCFYLRTAAVAKVVRDSERSTMHGSTMATWRQHLEYGSALTQYIERRQKCGKVCWASRALATPPGRSHFILNCWFLLNGQPCRLHVCNDMRQCCCPGVILRWLCDAAAIQAYLPAQWLCCASLHPYPSCRIRVFHVWLQLKDDQQNWLL